MEGDASLQHLNEDGVTGSVFLEGLVSGKGKSHDLAATGVKHLEGAGAGEERLHVGLELLAKGIGAVIGARIGVVGVERGDAFGELLGSVLNGGCLLYTSDAADEL